MNIKKEIEICYQLDGSCAKTAVEISRKVLGYKSGSCLNKGSVASFEFASIVGKLFPNHKIIAYCSKEVSNNIGQKNVKYGGTLIKFDPNPCIWLFAYHLENDDKGHMVIGFPVAYGNTVINAAYKIFI